MPINAKNASWQRWGLICILAASLLLEGRCVAQNKLICRPAVDGTMAVGDGVHPLPGGTPLTTYVLTQVQGSACGLSLGGSSSRGAADFDQRLFGSLTYTIGYADFSGGFIYSETKVRAYFGDSPDRLNPTIIRRDRFFFSTGIHPTMHSEISAQWARDVHGRDWTVGIRGIDRFWASQRLEIYGYLNFDRFQEDKWSRSFGGDLISVGMRARRKMIGPISIYGELSISSASGAESSGSKQNAGALLGFSYRHGYHDSAEISRIGIRDH
jgi:hypothetical protein